MKIVKKILEAVLKVEKIHERLNHLEDAILNLNKAVNDLIVQSNHAQEFLVDISTGKDEILNMMCEVDEIYNTYDKDDSGVLN